MSAGALAAILEGYMSTLIPQSRPVRGSIGLGAVVLFILALSSIMVTESRFLAFGLKRSSGYFVGSTRLRGGSSGPLSSWMDGVITSPTSGDAPLIITGPSGVGKGTIIGKMMKDFPNSFGFSVSHTTRLPRPGEIDGQHYHFTDKETMQEMIREGKFLEHAEVHSNFYGSSVASVSDVQRSGRICILDIDVQGQRSVKSGGLLPSAKYLFISPPSFEALEARLRGRGTETEEALERRLGNAKAEIEYGTSQGVFDAVIVNDDLETASSELKQILHQWYPNHLEFSSSQ